MINRQVARKLFYTHRGPHRLPDLLSGAHAENKDDDITDAF